VRDYVRNDVRNGVRNDVRNANDVRHCEESEVARSCLSWSRRKEQERARERARLQMKLAASASEQRPAARQRAASEASDALPCCGGTARADDA